MVDSISKRARSSVMASVRSTGNRATELKLRAILQKNGIIGWRRKQKVLGSPDFVFRSARLALFVDGCFWHFCRTCYRRPASNRKYWDAKAQRNVARDIWVARKLRQSGWKVLRVWEHELRAPSKVANRIKAVLSKN